jgi:hypothetical protein
VTVEIWWLDSHLGQLMEHLSCFDLNFVCFHCFDRDYESFS